MGRKNKNNIIICAMHNGSLKLFIINFFDKILLVFSICGKLWGNVHPHKEHMVSPKLIPYELGCALCLEMIVLSNSLWSYNFYPKKRDQCQKAICSQLRSCLNHFILSFNMAFFYLLQWISYLQMESTFNFEKWYSNTKFSVLQKRSSWFFS